MKIFISWSGVRSHKVALLLKEWLQSVIQVVDPWVSSEDIERGAIWFNDINVALADVSIGIVCLTEENKNKPWILFESGALTKGLTSNKVCTFLIDLKPTELQNPLAQFNHTEPTQESLLKLIKTLNNSLGEKKLSDSVINNSFEAFYPQFEIKFGKILKDVPTSTSKKHKSQTELLEEILLNVRKLEQQSYIKEIKYIEMLQTYVNDSVNKTLYESAAFINNLKSASLSNEEPRPPIKLSALETIRRQYKNQKNISNSKNSDSNT